MMRPAIRVENLGKCYRLNPALARQDYHTLRETLVSLASWPVRRLRGGPNGTRTEPFWALKDVSFDIHPGEVVGVIGRNGAGKSTLLKVLSRITQPTSGSVELTGRVGSLLEVGTGFHPELSGRENVYLNGAILGMTRREIARKFDEIVAFAEIEQFLETPVKRYSSGMYVRLAFAVAAHLEPEILLVDEVLAVGDARFQEKCLGAMQRTAATGRTVIFVSHNMATIRHLCGRAILLKSGQIAADASPSTVIKSYLSEAHETSRVCLRDWHDRETTGEGRIVFFEILDALGQPVTSVPVGGTIRFRLKAEFYKPFVDPQFGVLIHQGSGEPMLDLRSLHAGLRVGRVQGSVTIETLVENIGLYPGTYLLSPWTNVPGLGKDIDWVRYCCTLRVEPAPGAFGDLRLVPELGRYWVASRWQTARVGDGERAG